MQGRQTQLHRLEQILEASARLHSTLNLPVLLQRLVETATRLTQAEACSVLLVDRKTGELRFEAGTRLPGGESETNPVADWVVRNGKPLLISETSQDSRFLVGVEAQAHSILAVPLVVRGVTTGVLEVWNKPGDTSFAEDDLETLTCLASHAAIAIENARAFHEANLVSDIIHELRTPLTSIVGYSKMLLISEALDPKTRLQFLETIHREATRMGNLVNDILELSRLESGHIHLAQEPLALNPLLREVVALLGQRARDKGLDVRVDLAEPSPTVAGDAQRLRQVFLNLLDNAIKYNHPGGWIAVRSEERSGGFVAVAVQDSGRGIAPEYVPRLFERFFRLDEEGLPTGSGLGLAIARQIMEIHGGCIEVQSEPGKGSTFTVVLPVQGRGTR
ncbi:MAG: ATP-binding protein [Anaerolineae bacterium]